MIVPTLCVGTPPGTLCVPPSDAERHEMRSHAERENVQARIRPPPPAAEQSGPHTHPPASAESLAACRPGSACRP
ncbi:hypothetical protein FJ692_01930 [Pseudomonas fluorescens]|nr:hypothetical protein C1751_13080 [Pseudomonas fluorescens]TPV61518.1 hypothetical protein FJ692_01930 [Pseudomonas fluorescens]